MWLYDVHKKGSEFHIVREDCSVRAKRKRLTHAIQVRDALLFGEKYPTERQQVLRDRADLHIEDREELKMRYLIVDSFGVVVRYFKYRHLADWWLKNYRSQKPVRAEAGPESDNQRGERTESS